MIRFQAHYLLVVVLLMALSVMYPISGHCVQIFTEELLRHADPLPSSEIWAGPFDEKTYCPKDGGIVYFHDPYDALIACACAGIMEGGSLPISFEEYGPDSVADLTPVLENGAFGDGFPIGMNWEAGVENQSDSIADREDSNSGSCFIHTLH